MKRTPKPALIFFLCLGRCFRYLRPLPLFLIAITLFVEISAVRGGTLPEHLKRLTSALSSRNIDSLRLLIDPSRIFVEIAPKEGSYLSPAQTLGVVESFFRTHAPISFSYILVKEEGNTGIAVGTLIVNEGGAKISRKVNFGFQKNDHANWLLSRITIR
jgi:hypothetical protein